MRARRPRPGKSSTRILLGLFVIDQSGHDGIAMYSITTAKYEFKGLSITYAVPPTVSPSILTVG